MKRYGVFAVAVLTLLGMLAPPVFAQEMPKPKVTINGFFDFVTTWTENIRDTDYTNDETEWYSRQRGTTRVTGEVGKAKAVTEFEMDFSQGLTSTASLGTGLGLTTDKKAQIEVKWAYLQFPLTGPGGLLPMIEQPTTARLGAQPFSGHDFKRILAVDQFGGVNFVTAFAPNVRNTFTFVQTEEGLESTGTEPDSWAILDSVEFTPQKGLTVKPTIAHHDDQADFGSDPRRETRTSIGVDAEWREGPYTLEPTFFFQWGEESGATASTSRDISAWFVDVLGNWRSGPLKLGARFVYTPGDKPEDPATDDIDSWKQISNSSTYYAGWSLIFTTAFDYYRRLNDAGTNIGWLHGGVNHGRIGFTAMGDYSVTPALMLSGLVHGFWAAEDVDTTGNGVGDENFVGTEVGAYLTWKFAPNLTFVTAYAHLFAGDALDRSDAAGVADAEDVNYWTTRVRYTF